MRVYFQTISDTVNDLLSKLEDEWKKNGHTVTGVPSTFNAME